MELDQIINGCLLGDRFCQKALFDRFSGRKFSVCLRYAKTKADAEDLVQDGFVKVFLNLEQYKNDGPFEQWVRRIMINNAIKKYHKKSNQNEYSSSDYLPEEAIEPDVVNKLGEGELLKIIAELPDGFRMVFNLYAIEGYSHKEVSELLHIEESTSRSQLTKARKILQEKLLKFQKSYL